MLAWSIQEAVPAHGTVLLATLLHNSSDREIGPDLRTRLLQESVATRIWESIRLQYRDTDDTLPPNYLEPTPIWTLDPNSHNLPVTFSLQQLSKDADAISSQLEAPERKSYKLQLSARTNYNASVTNLDCGKLGVGCEVSIDKKIMQSLMCRVRDDQTKETKQDNGPYQTVITTYNSMAELDTTSPLVEKTRAHSESFQCSDCGRSFVQEDDLKVFNSLTSFI